MFLTLILRTICHINNGPGDKLSIQDVMSMIIEEMKFPDTMSVGWQVKKTELQLVNKKRLYDGICDMG